MKRIDVLQRGLGSRLRGLREASGLSMVAAAAEAGVSRQHLWRLERELAPSPPLSLLLKLAVLYEANPATIMLPQVSKRDQVLATIWHNMEMIAEVDWGFLEDLADRVATDKK